jgi:Ankyrin repeats (many copies)/Ankyrin repeats (3 copies)
MITKKFNKVAFAFLCATVSSAYGMQKLTALHVHCAAGRGHLEVVQLIVNSGAVGINAKAGWEEKTPLHCAAGRGHIEVVQWLLENKADVNACSWRGRTALHCAALCGHMAVAQCLINYGANLHARDRDGHTALMLAKQLDIAQLLIDNNSDINAVDRFGHTALHHAVFFYRSDLIKLLVKNGADFTIKNNKGETVLDTAITKNNHELQGLLESYSKLEQQVKINPTREVFEKAVEEGYFVLVKNIIVSYKINVTKEDIGLAKAAWQNTNEAIYKKIGCLLIAYCNLLEEIATSQPGFRVPREIIELIGSCVVEEKSF